MAEKKETKQKTPEKVEEAVNKVPVKEEQKKEETPKEPDLDNFGDLVKLISSSRDINDIKSSFYKHLLKILDRNSISKNYHVLLIYEPNKSIDQGMADKIYNAIPDDNDKPILLIIHNNGGRIEPAYLISKSCKELSPKFAVAIPSISFMI